MATKIELQNVLTELQPEIDETGETSSSFTNAISSLDTVIDDQVAKLESENASPEAMVDIANNFMESMSTLFTSWTTTTEELNSTTVALQKAAEITESIVGILAGNPTDDGEEYTNVKGDVGSNFLQSINDMISYGGAWKKRCFSCLKWILRP